MANLIKNRRLAVLALSLALPFLAGCSAKGIYYLPTKVYYQNPKALGLDYDLIQFESLNGKKLYGIYFKTASPRKGVIIHFHGNYGNVSNHFGLSTFLLRYGFDLFVFDYQGYGGSEGKPTPERTAQDGQAAVQYVLSVTSGTAPIGVFGQSIGAAIGSVAAAREPEVDAVVLEAGFSTYKAIIKDVMRRGWLLKPFSFFVPWIIAQRGLDPADYASKIAPRPLLILHGDRDRTIPVRMAQEIYAKALEPKRLWIVEGADHLQIGRMLGEKYEREIAEFFTAAFQASKKKVNPR